MPYTGTMQEAVKAVERTRARRLKEVHPRLTPDEKQDLLVNFHPDYRPDAQRELMVGRNRGQRMPVELVDVLEARSRINPDKFDLDAIDREVDVLVVGGGGGGSAAALTAHAAGAKVLQVTKLRLGDANTMMAQGGIQAADKENDSPILHYLDVLGGGGYVNHPELVKALVTDAPYVIQWLEQLGTMFNKYPDGTMETIHGGGTSRKRMHFARDYTGAEIMRTLRDEVQNQGIEVIEFCPVVELLLDEHGACGGAILYSMDTEKYLIVRARIVIMATGGFGRLHVSGFETTNHYGATGDGLIMAYRAGANLVFLDATQFHPTGVGFPEQIVGQLVTEKVRGLGAQLVNADGEQFVFPLETRDAVSAAIIRECQQQGKGLTTITDRPGVWLDSPMIDLLGGKGTVEKQLPAMFRQYARFDINMAKEPILIYPTLHYQNGGVEINDRGETAVANLLAAGEVSGGVHGRNRLMGNSLLDILVFGRRAGVAAAERVKHVTPGKLSLDHVRRYNQEVAAAQVSEHRNSPILLPMYGSREVASS